MEMKVSVIIPTLNEENAIGKVLGDIPKGFVNEILVVDSSTDGTAMIAKNLGANVISVARKGYGLALQTGVEKAKGEIVIYIDGDYTYDPKEMKRLVQPILDGNYDVVLGNRLRGRMLPGSMSLLNRFGNILLSLLFSILLFRKVGDTQCGFRAIRKRFLEEFSCISYGMPYVTEQLVKLVKKGARIGDVPVTYRPRIGETKLCAWTDGFKILKVILKECFVL
ncbi:MAG: glycosyltransferase family 2 protein [Candidatus Hermodarchaeota archaeon]